jgi:hypothetical protein
LVRACELCPDEEAEVEDTSEDCGEESEKYQHTSKYQSTNPYKYQLSFPIRDIITEV